VEIHGWKEPGGKGEKGYKGKRSRDGEGGKREVSLASSVITHYQVLKVSFWGINSEEIEGGRKVRKLERERRGKGKGCAKKDRLKFLLMWLSCKRPKKGGGGPEQKTLERKRIRY